MTGPERASLTTAVDQIESVHRLQGRDFVAHFGATLRILKMYPLENAQAQRALSQLAESARKLLQVDAILELQLTGEFVFINPPRRRRALAQRASSGNAPHPFKKPGGRGVGAPAFENDHAHSAAPLDDDPFQFIQPIVSKRPSRLGQPARHARRIEPRQQMTIERRIVAEIRR